jgi:hypothetical protein
MDKTRALNGTEGNSSIEQEGIIKYLLNFHKPNFKIKFKERTKSTKGN